MDIKYMGEHCSPIKIINNKNIEKRILFYWSKMYIENIKAGQNYEELEKTEIALKLKKENIDIEIICRVTGLSKKEVENIDK